jgi:hypothetical protein
MRLCARQSSGISRDFGESWLHLPLGQIGHPNPESRRPSDG